MARLRPWHGAILLLAALAAAPWYGCSRALEQSDAAVALPALIDQSTGDGETDANWSGWLGGPKLGVAPDQELPHSWSSSDGYRWKIDVPGEGNSSPVVWGDDVIVTTAVGSGSSPQLKVLCYDRGDGSLRWEADARAAAGNTHVKNGYASASVATDGERIIAFFGSAGLYCFDFSGEQQWHVDLGPLEHIWGTASSPTIYGDLVFQLCDRAQDSYLAAFHKATGDEVWRTSRDSNGCWTTPVVVEAELAGGQKRAELIVNGTGTKDSAGGWVIAYDPAHGTELWRVQGTTDIVCPTAMVGGGLVFSTSGRNGPTIAIRPGGSGNVTDSHVVWKLRRGGAYVPTGVFYGNRLFTVTDGGVAACYNAGNGELVWRERLGGSFTSSIVAGAGRVYAINERGTVYVIAARDEYELVGTCEMSDRCLTTPAISDGEIFLRTASHLYCIAKKAESPAPATASRSRDEAADDATEVNRQSVADHARGVADKASTFDEDDTFFPAPQPGETFQFPAGAFE